MFLSDIVCYINAGAPDPNNQVPIANNLQYIQYLITW